MNICSAPTGGIIGKHGLGYSICEEDIGMYTVFDVDHVDEAITHSEVCADGIGSWMRCKMLKLSDDKTELLIISRRDTFRMPCHGDQDRGHCDLASPAGMQSGCHILINIITIKAHISSVCGAVHDFTCVALSSSENTQRRSLLHPWCTL